MHGEHLTIDECNELAEALRQDAAAFTKRVGEREFVEAGGVLSRPREHKKDGSSQSELTHGRPAARRDIPIACLMFKR